MVVPPSKVWPSGFDKIDGYVGEYFTVLYGREYPWEWEWESKEKNTIVIDVIITSGALTMAVPVACFETKYDLTF